MTRKRETQNGHARDLPLAALEPGLLAAGGEPPEPAAEPAGVELAPGEPDIGNTLQAYLRCSPRSRSTAPR
jgi:hypothetical protein